LRPGEKGKGERKGNDNLHVHDGEEEEERKKNGGREEEEEEEGKTKKIIV